MDSGTIDRLSAAVVFSRDGWTNRPLEKFDLIVNERSSM